MTRARRLTLLTRLKEQAYASSFPASDRYSETSWSAYRHYSRLLDKELGYADTGT